MCCCFICSSCIENSTTEGVNKFKRLRKRQHEAENVFEELVDILSGSQKEFQEIEYCRINPDYSTETRNDIEFFIPQIFGYIIDNYSDTDSIKKILIKILIDAAEASFYFSHRLYFFIKAYEADLDLPKDVKEL